MALSTDTDGQRIDAGPSPICIKLGGLCLCPNICFENTVPHLVRRQVRELIEAGQSPDALITVTNDGWFWGSSLLDHHLACGVFRADRNAATAADRRQHGFFGSNRRHGPDSGPWPAAGDGPGDGDDWDPSRQIRANRSTSAGATYRRACAWRLRCWRRERPFGHGRDRLGRFRGQGADATGGRLESGQPSHPGDLAYPSAPFQG